MRCFYFSSNSSALLMKSKTLLSYFIMISLSNLNDFNMLFSYEKVEFFF